jgi:hypothetical protein
MQRQKAAESGARPALDKIDQAGLLAAPGPLALSGEDWSSHRPLVIWLL